MGACGLARVWGSQAGCGLPPPDELAQEIADDLQTAWEQFASIAEKVKG